jgi:hypothetical protein
MTLERRYRWLLACYPREHRDQYGEEMLGVLLDDSGGRRHPSVGDVRDLLHGALRIRLRYAVRRLSDNRWRDAGTVFGLFAALIMLGHTSRIMLINLAVAGLGGGWEGLGQWPSWHPWVATTAWVVAVVAALGGRSRIAAASAWCGAAIETARAGVEYAEYFSVFNLWQVAIAVTGAAALSVATPRPAIRLLGRGRLTLLLASAALLAAGPAITVLVPSGDAGAMRTDLIFTTSIGYLEVSLLGGGYVFCALALVSAPGWLRWRVFAFLAPVAATLVLTRIAFSDWGLLARPFSEGIPVGLALTHWLALALVPPFALAIAVAAVHRRVVDRYVPFPQPFATVLKVHIDGQRGKGAVYLFESSWKRPYSDRGVRKILARRSPPPAAPDGAARRTVAPTSGRSPDPAGVRRPGPRR